MAKEIKVRGLPDAVWAALRRRAEKNERRLEPEIRAILVRAAKPYLP